MSAEAGASETGSPGSSRPEAAFPHRNNFDLIRLLAALQVVVVHGVEHLGLRLPAHDLSLRLLESFPGVPIFFAVSGFLITASWQRSRGAGEFFLNRALRIFPALWLCFFLSVGLIGATSYFSEHPMSVGGATLWAASQLTFVQFYNPDVLREWGIGAVNGSLWTIPVEMQFYLLTPLIVLIFLKKRFLFWAAVVLFVGVNLVHTQVLSADPAWDSIRKLSAVSFGPWVYMFMLGGVASLAWPSVRRFVEGRFPYWALACGAVAILNLFVDLGSGTNHILPPFALLLVGLTLSAAFTAPGLAETLLRRNDISYGLYIFHMPIYNMVIEQGGLVSTRAAWIVPCVVIAAAAASWTFVERPALALKKHPLFSRRKATVLPPAVSPEG